jgi:spore coat polysaccharide biosynthesis protein SpsF
MLAIVQARLSSTRLPGKVLMNLCGRSLLGRVVDRLSKARTVDRIVVATSSGSSDQGIVDFCEREGIRCHRGPLDDVAERFRQAAEFEAAEAFVRVSGDSPLIDSALVDLAVKYYGQAECDLVTNVLVRSFPKGQSVEVVRAATFNGFRGLLTEVQQKEHVTKVFYENPGAYRIVSFTSGMNAGAVNLSIDTPEDFARLEKLIGAVNDDAAGWRELLASYRSLNA